MLFDFTKIYNGHKKYGWIITLPFTVAFVMVSLYHMILFSGFWKAVKKTGIFGLKYVPPPTTKET